MKKFKSKITGIVLTGGFTNLDNLREIAIPIFGNMSVRIAKPKEIEGLFDNLKAPEFSTAIGLILYSLGMHSSYEIDSNKQFRSKYKITLIRIIDGCKSWMQTAVDWMATTTTTTRHD